MTWCSVMMMMMWAARKYNTHTHNTRIANVLTLFALLEHNNHYTQQC